MSSRLRWVPQFSLRSFLIAIAVLGIGLAAVLSASEGWALALALAFNLLLPTAIVLAIVLAGRPRAFWIGVAVFGLWVSVYFSEKGDFIANRNISELYSLLDDNLSPIIVGLHGARIEREISRVGEEELAFLRSRSPSPTNEAEIASRRESYQNRAVGNIERLATISATRFLMILLALAGGCLASYAYGLQHPGEKSPAAASGQGTASTTGTGGDGGKASGI